MLLFIMFCLMVLRSEKSHHLARNSKIEFLSVNDWNSLPDEVVNVPIVEKFKEFLDRSWISEHYVFD